MNLQSAAAAVILLVVLTRYAPAQETRPESAESRRIANWSRGTERERLSVLLFLEDSRSADVVAWKALLEKRDDPKFLARVIRGLGRVAEPELKPLLVEVLDNYDGPWTRDVQRAAGISVGLFGDPDLLPKLSARAMPRDVFFAIGLMKKLPTEGREPLLHLAESAKAMSAGEALSATFTDPAEAALRWGAALEEPVFAPLAKQVFAARDGAPFDQAVAAIDYFARSKVKAPADLRPALTAALKNPDPEIAGLAARALAKSEGAGAAEAAAIEAAFVGVTNRITRVDEVRALAALQTPRAFDALVHMLELSRGDPAVRRTVLETLKAVAAKLPEETRKTVAGAIRPIIQPEEGAAHAPPDVEAAAVTLLAVVDPDRFMALMPALRLVAHWDVRAAAAAALVVKPGAQEWVWRFLDDSDRRVRIATYEALADKPDGVPFLNFGAASSRTGIEVKQPGAATEMSLRTSDPAELACIAKFYATFPTKLEIPRTFLEDATSLIPDHEVEALQSVLDLAGKENREYSNKILRNYLKSPEISLRKRAKDLLKKNGIEAKEAPPAASGPGFNTERVDRMLEKPVSNAVIETNKGSITIQLFRDDAPATVENFLKLAKSGFYDGILWHRVVPAFVAQAGCPRGDGWGGPGYTIRCEVNDRTYRRGSIGMALAGKDTGGCQFFICHRALPHLDGRYTLFGQVTAGMDVVDKLGQEDYIVKIREL